jgi:hypothetical protein
MRMGNSVRAEDLFGAYSALDSTAELANNPTYLDYYSHPYGESFFLACVTPFLLLRSPYPNQTFA